MRYGAVDRVGAGAIHRLGMSGVVLIGMAAALMACTTPAKRETARSEASAARAAALRGSGPPGRVIVITVAGLDSSDYLAPDGFVVDEGERVRMPNLARLAREGVFSVRALPPSPGSSYAAHASLVTGRLPSHHGVVADTKLSGDGGVVHFWDSRLLNGTALWDAAIGRGVMALGWPTTVGARIELVLPEARPNDSETSWLDFMRKISSPFLIHELEAIAAQALGGNVAGAGSKRNPNSWPTPRERDAALSEIACHVALSERDPGLWLIRFSETQGVLRAIGAGTVEVAAALRRVDTEIGSIVDCLAETGQLVDTAIFVVGDVAFEPVHTRVDPNVALVRVGLIGRDPRSKIGVRSWLAMSRSSGRSAYVYAKDADNALAARNTLEKEAEKTGAFRVVPAAELAQTDVDPQAWFGLEAMPGFEIGDGLMRPILRPSLAKASAGALRGIDDSANSVGFVGWGRGIRRGVRVSELDLVDFAPTVAMLVGLRLDEPIDGQPILGILRAAVPPPPPGPKRVGVGNPGDIDRTLRELGGGR